MKRRRVRRRRRLYYPLIALGLVLLLFFISVVGAATTPGNEDFKSKWADWLRGHHLSVVVTPLEQWYYDNQAPSKGGQPKSLNALPSAHGGTVPATVTGPSGTTRPTTGASSQTTIGTIPPKGSTSPTSIPRPAANKGVAHLPAPAPVPLVVSPALQGEGRWLPVGPLVHGVPAMYEAQFRADNVYTSQITSAVWIDPTLLKVSLVPGAQEPGGTWSETPDLVGQAALAAVAAFNGGFRFQDAHGGFFLDGRQAVPLQDGAASVVIYDTGRINIGTWGNEVSMTPHVKAVLQNLIPIVDHGQTAPSATYQDSNIWGATLGAQTVIARSGIGVTANGALLYVAGPALTAKSLAESLQRAGAVRAMALDLNPEWVTFNFFSHDAAGNVSGTKLYPEMQRPADRYLGPTAESRDFFVVSAPS
ncbi:MAG: phosphodiester glycosidase family protein [Acidimicrobiaceae bacterium]|nr:phosphodiester glycosidase family protein [Acidimicrobiaceae bacterium]